MNTLQPSTTGYLGDSWQIWPTASYPTITYVQTAPTVCTNELHVFPCPHCKKCKCGQAEKK